MATIKKMTKKDYFAMLKAIPAVAENPALVEFIDHEVELLNRKNSSEKKPTATQQANEALKQAILSEMEPNRLYTCSEMIKVLPCCADLSTPKVSAVVGQMVKAEVLTRTEDKRKAYFSIAE